MKKYLFLFSLCLLFISSCSSEAPENLIKNSGFEVQDSSGKSTPWRVKVHAGERAYNFDVDKEKFFEGKSSFRIEQYKKQGFGLVTQKIILPNKELKKITFSSKVATKDIVKGTGLQLSVNFRGVEDFIIKQVKSESITGTTDWTDLSLSADIPKGTMNLTASMVITNIGTVWIDKVSLVAE